MVQTEQMQSLFPVTMELTSISPGVTTDVTHGFHNYEALTFNNGANNSSSSATFNANQFGTGLISNSLAVTGTGRRQAITVNNASNFFAANWTFSNWDGNDNITINGTSNADNITGSIRADTISGNNGNDIINSGVAPAMTPLTRAREVIRSQAAMTMTP